MHHNQLHGFFAYWINNCYGAIYFGLIAIGFLGMGLSFMMPTIIILELDILLTSSCVCSLLVWQSIRLISTEWQSLVPNYTQYKLRQFWLLLMITHIIMVLTAVGAEEWNILLKLPIILLGGALSLFIVRVKSHVFNSALMVFMIISQGLLFLPAPPLWLSLSVFALSLVLYRHYHNLIAHDTFNPASVKVYQHANRTAWLPVPQKLLNLTFTPRIKALYPLNYFANDAVLATLLFWPLVMLLLLAVVIIQPEIGSRLTLAVAHISVFTGFYLSWAIRRNLHTWRELMLLPLYQDKQALIQALTHGHRVFYGFLFLISLTFGLLMVAVVSEIGLVQVINFSLLTVVNSALMCWIAYFFASNLSPALGIMLVLIASPIAMVNFKAHFNSPVLMAAIAMTALVTVILVDKSINKLMENSHAN